MGVPILSQEPLKSRELSLVGGRRRSHRFEAWWGIRVSSMT